MSDACRPERVIVNGELVPVIVRGSGPLENADLAALAELVKATREHRNTTIDSPAGGAQ